jgi:GNAT superfamily N-acetyltransferase
VTAEITVTRLARDRIPETAAMLARAFDDSPLFTHILPKPRSRGIVMRMFFRVVARDAEPLGEAYVAKSGDAIVGAALWLKPGDYPPGKWRLLRQTVGTFMMGPIAPRSLGPSMRYLRATEKVHPKDAPHWYLAVLGVEPSWQGRGVGGQLLRDRLDVVDEQGLATYLETDKERNLAYYARYRFAQRLELHPDGDHGPPTWTMWRDPVD